MTKKSGAAPPRIRKDSGVEVLHHGRLACTLRGSEATECIAELEASGPQDGQLLMARVTGTTSAEMSALPVNISKSSLRTSPRSRDMPIHSETLSSLASDYAKGMASIRGRRVQRLLKREFAGAEYVAVVEVSAGTAAVLGLSASGAAFCATDGRGKQASVVRWLHGSTDALETHYDLLKDSLPVLSSRSMPLAGLCRQAHLRVSAGSVPPQARALVSMAIQALA